MIAKCKGVRAPPPAVETFLEQDALLAFGYRDLARLSAVMWERESNDE